MTAVIDKAGELVGGHAESNVGRGPQEEQEIFRLTPLGLFSIHADEVTARRIADATELYMRRNGRGMAIVNNQLAFVEMEPVEEAQP